MASSTRVPSSAPSNVASPSPPDLRPVRSRFRVSILVVCTTCYLGFIVLLAIFGEWLAPYDIDEIDLLLSLRPPAFVEGGDAHHVLGTDFLGRDTLSRLLFAIRLSCLIALVGTAISAVLGTVLGILAAHFRGLFEDTIMMAVDAQASMPFIVFALSALAFLGNSFLVLIIVVGINGWEQYARLARGMILSVQTQDYVLAAESLGVGTGALYRRHIFPNISSALIIQFTITLPGTILLESALSFLGLGVQPPFTSLGQMLGEGRDYLLITPWPSVIPGMVIFLLTLSISLLGDWLRDVLDPTLRGVR